MSSQNSKVMAGSNTKSSAEWLGFFCALRFPCSSLRFLARHSVFLQEPIE
jgi:hypothetical protein